MSEPFSEASVIDDDLDLEQENDTDRALGAVFLSRKEREALHTTVARNVVDALTSVRAALVESPTSALHAVQCIQLPTDIAELLGVKPDEDDGLTIAFDFGSRLKETIEQGGYDAANVIAEIDRTIDAL